MTTQQTDHSHRADLCWTAATLCMPVSNLHGCSDLMCVICLVCAPSSSPVLAGIRSKIEMFHFSPATLERVGLPSSASTNIPPFVVIASNDINQVRGVGGGGCRMCMSTYPNETASPCMTYCTAAGISKLHPLLWEGPVSTKQHCARRGWWQLVVVVPGGVQQCRCSCLYW